MSNWTARCRTGRIRTLTLIVSALVVSGACGVVGPRNLPLSGPVPEARGRLVYARPGAFWTLEPATMQTVPLFPFPPGAFVGEPAVSPAGVLLAFTGLLPGPDGVYGRGADLYVIDLTGGRPPRTVAAAARDVAYTGVAWAPDGRTLYVAREARGQSPRIERRSLAGSSPIPVAEGHSPTVAADGRLGYLTRRRDGRQTLWVANAQGDEPRRVIADREFFALAAPRFAPAAPHIVFAAVGGPRIRQSPPQGPRPTGRRQLPVAYAHGGPPWELWLVKADGSGLRRLTDIREDYLVPTWSPDGRWIGIAGESGLYIFELTTGRLLRLARETSTGGLAWIGGTR